MRNILVRNSDHDAVYVQCMSCRQPVARYVLAPRGYFHYGKEVESFLRMLQRAGDLSSARDLKADFEAIKKECEEKFDEVLKQLAEQGKND